MKAKGSEAKCNPMECLPVEPLLVSNGLGMQGADMAAFSSNSVPSPEVSQERALSLCLGPTARQMRDFHVSDVFCFQL